MNYEKPYVQKEVYVLAAYETMMVFSTKLIEEERSALLKRFCDLISENGSIVSVDEWGKRKLAYEIQKETDGYYVLVTFESEPAFISELERIMRITDNLLRTLVIRLEHPKDEAEPVFEAPEIEEELDQEESSDEEEEQTEEEAPIVEEVELATEEQIEEETPVEAPVEVLEEAAPAESDEEPEETVEETVSEEVSQEETNE